MYQGETPSLFHLIESRKRRDARTTTDIRDENGELQTTTRGLLRTFVGYMMRKYGPILVEVQCVDHMVTAGHIRAADRWGGHLRHAYHGGGSTYCDAQNDGKQIARA